MPGDCYEVLTVEEVMDYLLMGRNTLYWLLQTGKMKGFRIGKKWRIPKKSIEEYIDHELRSVSHEG